MDRSIIFLPADSSTNCNTVQRGVKHLVGRLESEPLSGPVIQSVFDHSQILICDSFHAPLLGMYWCSKPLKFSLLPRCRLQYGSAK